MILKWQGGKGRYRELIRPLMPPATDSYVEPFFGGGGALFGLFHPHTPQDQSVLSRTVGDLNPGLVHLWRAVRDNDPWVRDEAHHLVERYAAADPEERRAMCRQWRDEYNEERVRLAASRKWDYPAHYPPGDTGAFRARMALLMICLNRCGFNGLYRENKAGRYNTPPNADYRVSNFALEDWQAAHEVLASGVRILESAWFDTCRGGAEHARLNTGRDGAPPRTFYLADPPYLPVSEDGSGNFAEYTAEGFGPEEHDRLLAELCFRGHTACAWLLFNHLQPLKHLALQSASYSRGPARLGLGGLLHKGSCALLRFSAARTGGTGKGRGATEEGILLYWPREWAPGLEDRHLPGTGVWQREEDLTAGISQWAYTPRRQ